MKQCQSHGPSPHLPAWIMHAVAGASRFLVPLHYPSASVVHNGRCLLIPGPTPTWILLQRWQMLPRFSPCPVHGWILQEGWQVHPAACSLSTATRVPGWFHPPRWRVLLTPSSRLVHNRILHAKWQVHRAAWYSSTTPRVPRWSFPAYRRKLVHLRANCRVPS